MSGLLFSAGCRSWLAQEELARNEGGRLVVPILSTIDPRDEAETQFADADEVRPEDLKAIESDYVIGRNDLITVSILDLTGERVETVRTARVSETGLLSLPMLPEPIKAAGLTEQELQKAITDKYREAGLLTEATLTITVVEARQRTFWVTGAVGRPGQYTFWETDYRLLNALAQAGDIQTNVIDSIYVIRKTRSEKPATVRPSTEIKKPAPTPAKDPLMPGSDAGTVNRPVMAAEQPATRPAGTAAPAPGNSERIIIIDGQPRVIGSTTRTAAPLENPPGAPGTTAQPEPPKQPPYEFGSGAGEEEERVIRIPLNQLRSGDLRYNVVIRPDDMVIVPLPGQGFYYMGGHVGTPGVFNLPPQKITLMQAIISARMLDPLAVPQKTDVIRRIGDQQLYVRVNLQRIFDGLEPDLYLKPNDTVMVGTDFYPPFLVALRGAFRATYGFGFLYDRNYAPIRNGDR